MHRLYPSVRRSDVPFAQDCFGDQFLFRDLQIWQLDAETGEVRNLELTMKELFAALATRPVEFLGLQPLVSFQTQGHTLAPDQGLLCWPPLATREAENGLTVQALPKFQQLTFLSDVAQQLAQAKPGETLRFARPAGSAAP